MLDVDSNLWTALYEKYVKNTHTQNKYVIKNVNNIFSTVYFCCWLASDGDDDEGKSSSALSELSKVPRGPSKYNFIQQLGA